jgi:outer membrane protein TolC
LRLTLDDAIRLAQEKSASLQTLRASVDVARGSVRDAISLENLELKLGRLSLGDVLLPGQTYQLDLSVVPPHAIRQAAEVAKARATLEQLEAQAAAEEVAIANDIRLRFEELALLEEERTAEQSILTAQTRLAELAQTRIERSVATRVDGALARLAREERAQAVLELTLQGERARASLLQRLELPPTQQVELVLLSLKSTELPGIPDESALLQAAFRQRPDLRATAASANVAQAQTRATWLQQLPTVSYVQLGYTLAPLPWEATFKPWSISAGLEIPLPGFNRSGLHAARASERAAQKQVDASVQSIDWEVRSAHREAVAARRLLDAYLEGAVPVALQAEKEIQAALDAGQVDLVEVALIQEKSAAVQQKRVSLTRDYLAALARLRSAIGGDLPGGSSAGGHP